MNLQSLIEQYVTFRQSLGERFETNAKILRAFGRAVGSQVAVTEVCAEQVNTFLAGTGPLTSAWHGRYNALRGFYRHAISRGHVTDTPLPTLLPPQPPRFVPYIYSLEELRHLMQTIDATTTQRCILDAVTMRMILLLLYGTGLRGGEAIALNRDDVDMTDSLLTVRQTKFFKTRLVPFGPQLRPHLAEYAARSRSSGRGPRTEAAFLTSTTGSRINHHTLQGHFRRMCERAGIRRSDGARYQPRLHDLRHTFAVHRLTSWYRQGADVQRLLPQLSVYLGHVCIASTQVYLSMTPELLQEAGMRFQRYAFAENIND